MDEYIKKSDIKKAFLKGFTDRKKYPEFVNWIAKEAERIVNNMPTADVQPIKHGRWREISSYRDDKGDILRDYECSVCLGINRDVPECLNPDLELDRYCPMCGARMDR